ncbi:MAG: ankyrin repeat domain-containing protein [Verrucomicrobiota bacterium]
MKSLPVRPSLDQLKHQAKDLLKAYQSQEPEATQRFHNAHPDFRDSSLQKKQQRKFGLSDSQCVLAREYGFESWSKLKVEVQRLSWNFEQKYVAFIEAALNDRIGVAQAILEDVPEVMEADIYAASVVGHYEQINYFLEHDPRNLKRRGGPRKNWDALLYLSNSHLHKLNDHFSNDIVKSAKLLLERGADPNVAYYHPMWPNSPLRPLYGACGVTNHPKLARVLLEAGAHVNDGESMYHAAENNYRECMELLLEYGEDISARQVEWQNTPLFFLVGWEETHRRWPIVARGISWLLENGADPNTLCERQEESSLHAAIRQNHSVELIEQLLQYGADPNLPRKDGKSSYHLALLKGDAKVIECLREGGAQHPQMSEKDLFLSACFAGNTQQALRLIKEKPDLFNSLDSHEKLSLVEAAKSNNIVAVETMLSVGFDIREKGVSDWGGHAPTFCSLEGKL